MKKEQKGCPSVGIEMHIGLSKIWALVALIIIAVGVRFLLRGCL